MALFIMANPTVSTAPSSLPAHHRPKVMAVFGTRPEAIKMAPVVRALQQADGIDSLVCVTAQHREMLDQVLALFSITPDEDLNVMQPNQDLFDVTTNVMLGMKQVLEQHQPDLVLVHGDTTTTMATSLACFYKRIPVGHVEAGLRTFNMAYPFPEELNRWVTDAVCDLYFCPTEQSAENVRQCLPQKQQDAGVQVTGNTVIDALQYTIDNSSVALPITLQDDQRLILATVHRRENFGQPLHEICDGILEIIETVPDTVLLLPVHPNPNVGSVVRERLGHHPRIHLVAPLDYPAFCHAMAASTLILTDSGGVQEEAPSLGKPVLVLRDETERPEAVTMGTVKLVGPHRQAIVAAATELLTNPAAYNAMANQVNPYGDGHATERIVASIRSFFAERTASVPV